MLDSYTITQYVAACAKKAGVSIVWEEGAVPSTNGRSITLPLLSAYATAEQKVRLMQYVKHETSHILYSDFELLNKNKPQGLLAFINNLLEDHRVDYLNDSQYLGDKHNTEEFMRLHAAELEGHTLSDQAKDVYIPLFAWDNDIRDDLWTRTADPYTDVSDDGKKVYDKLHSADYASVLRNIRNIENKEDAGVKVYDLAKRILVEVFGVGPESMEGESAAKRIEAANAEGDDGSKSDDSKDIKNAVIDMPTPYAEHKGEHEGEVKIPAVGGGKGDYFPTPANMILEYNFCTHKGNFIVSEDHGHSNRYIELSHRSDNLTNQIRSKLQVMTRDRYEYGKKRGKLNNSSLYRVGMKDAKGLNERLFKQKIVNKQLDIAVQILVDSSGSMHGSKYEYASAAAIILNKVLSDALNIPVEILSFTDTSDAHRMFIVKEFDRKVSDIHVANAFSTVHQYMWDNVDGESLVYGHNRIGKRKEKRKMMVVLSDGAPCGGHRRGNISTYTKKVISSIEKSPVELIGVGLCYTGVSNYYKRSTVIERASQIELALLNLISNNILK